MIKAYVVTDGIYIYLQICDSGEKYSIRWTFCCEDNRWIYYIVRNGITEEVEAGPEILCGDDFSIPVILDHDGIWRWRILEFTEDKE